MSNKVDKLLDIVQKNAYHIKIFNSETGELRDYVKEISKDIKLATKERMKMNIYLSEMRIDLIWLKKSYWLVASASIGGLISGILGLLFR